MSIAVLGTGIVTALVVSALWWWYHADQRANAKSESNERFDSVIIARDRESVSTAEVVGFLKTALDASHRGNDLLEDEKNHFIAQLDANSVTIAELSADYHNLTGAYDEAVADNQDLQKTLAERLVALEQKNVLILELQHILEKRTLAALAKAHPVKKAAPPVAKKAVKPAAKKPVKKIAKKKYPNLPKPTFTSWD
jgi:DNA repair exonuclease SbcCD ATPase subunit